MNRRRFLVLAALAPLAPRPRLVAFGDSITVGVGASSPDRAYAAIVARRLGRTLVNRAVSGSRIHEHLERIRATVFLPGDAALFLTGYNDMRAGTPLETYRALLSEALALLPAPLYLGGCLPMTEAGYAFGAPRWSHGGDEQAALYRSGVGVPLGGYDPRNTDDLVHPNDAGHAQLAEAFMAWRVWLPGVVQK